MERIGKETINLDELRNEMMVELERCNIHVLREKGSKLGVKSPTRHNKSKLVELIIEKKLQNHKPSDATSAREYNSLISSSDREMLMTLFKDSDEVDGEMVSGTIELLDEIDAFLRIDGSKISDGDVFVPQGILSQCKIKYGDKVIGKAVELKSKGLRGLVSVISVSGHRRRAVIRNDFLDMLARKADIKIPLSSCEDTNLRLMDIFSPLARGQRNMIFSKGLMDQTDLLCDIAKAFRESGIKICILLPSEKPEVIAYYKSIFSDSVVATTCEASDEENHRVAQITLEQLKRDAELGRNTAIIVSNMAPLLKPCRKGFSYKTLFGAGRQLENGGSLTVLGFSFLISSSGAAIYETLAPLCNSVAMLKSGKFMSDKPSLDIFESFTDFMDYDDTAKKCLAMLKQHIIQSNKILSDEEILEFYTKNHKLMESK